MRRNDVSGSAGRKFAQAGRLAAHGPCLCRGRAFGHRLRAAGIFSRHACGLCRAGAAAGWRRSWRPPGAPRRAASAGPFSSASFWSACTGSSIPSWSIPTIISGRCLSRCCCFRRAWPCLGRWPAAVAVYFWQDGAGAAVCLRRVPDGGGVVARPCPDRLSLESVRLWLGRVPGAAAIGQPDGRLWSFLPDHSFRRIPGRTRIAPLARARL